MGFKLPKEFYEKQQEKYDLKYIDFDGKVVHVSEFEDRSVTSEMKDNMRMNSYASDDMFSKYTDEALVDIAKYYLTNCSYPIKLPCVTYDEAVIHKILPEFIKRLEEKIELKMP